MDEIEPPAQSCQEESPVKRPLYLTLSLCYLLVSLATLFQMFRIILNRHRLLSYHFVFLSFCFFWMLLRFALFTLVSFVTFSDLPLTLSLPLSWAPFNIEIATYSLLTVFFARLSFKLDPGTKLIWRQKIKPRLFIAWTVFNLILLATVFTFIVLIITETIKFGNQSVMFPRFLLPAIVFGILALLFLYYGVRLYKVLQNPFVKYIPLTTHRSSINGVSYLLIFLLVLFLCRSIYSLIIAIEALMFDFYFRCNPVFRFLSLMISEIFPNISILIFFRDIPSGRRATNKFLPPAFYNSVNAAKTTNSASEDRLTSLFDDPTRYDSEEEEIITYTSPQDKSMKQSQKRSKNSLLSPVQNTDPEDHFYQRRGFNEEETTVSTIVSQ